MIITDQGRTINKHTKPTTAPTFRLNKLIFEAINIRQREAHNVHSVRIGSMSAGPKNTQIKDIG